MSETPDFAAVTQVQQTDLVEGRLLRRRQHRQLRQRRAGGGARAGSRRAGDRRRLRQRQRRDRGGSADDGGTWWAATTSRRCSSAAASARPRSASTSSSSRPTPRTFRSATARSTWRCRSSARCSRRTSRRPRQSCCAWSSPAAGSGWPTGPRTAPSERCSRRSPSTRRRRPASTRRCSGAPRSACASCFGDGISDLRSERRISRQPFRSADHYIEYFRQYFGPTQAAYERVGPEGEQALTDDLRAFLEEANTAGDRALVLEAEYLQVIATRA